MVINLCSVCDRSKPMAIKHVKVCCAILAVLICVDLFSSSNVFGCNIDTTNPVIYEPPAANEGFGEDYAGGLFGYSAALHEVATKNYILIGAPTANSFYLDVEKPGVLFLCEYPDPICVEINLDDSGNTDPVGPEYKHMKDNAWIGVSLTQQPSSSNDFNEYSDITVCGHRYANNYYVQYSTTPDPIDREEPYFYTPDNCDFDPDNSTYIPDNCTYTPDNSTTFDANDRFPNGICYTFGHARFGDIAKDDSSGVRASIPCAEYNQTDESTHTRVHGWCQAGMSAQYTSDGNNILLGAAGSYNWAGTVFEGDRVDLDFKPAPDVWGEDNDYTGYAVASGNFRSTDSIQGVTSAPRAMRRQQDITTGKVIIYDLETYEVYQELYGELMNTYYGAAIIAVDLNNDTWTDLLVGAPLYTVEHDEGRVYVYINNGRGEVEPQSFKLSGNDAYGARFGSAIAGAGDLNDDDYQDIVIGAPWEDDNSGAVYVYFGSADGIQSKYSQRLGGRDFIPDIKSFGLSVSGGLDIDSNFQPDVLVGAPLNDKVFLFQTRPVANLRVWLEIVPEPMDPDIKNCVLDGNPITCVNISVCFFYESKSTPTDQINMDIDLTIDYFRVQDGFEARFYFLEDGVPVSNFYEEEVEARYGEEVCYPYKAFLEETTVDFLTPLSLYLYYGIHDYSKETCRGDCAPRFYGGLPPIIDEDICGNGSLFDELRFIQDCGADAICQTDLQLNGNIIFPGGESAYPFGVYFIMHTEIQVDNVGEEAHNAKVIIRHSREILFEALEQTRSSCLSEEEEALCNIDVVVTCQPVESQNNTAAVECLLGNPMRPMTSSILRLRFNVGAVSYEESSGFLDMTVEASTISTELDPSNNIYQPRIPVVVLADMAVRGQSDPPTVLYETNTTVSQNENILNVDANGPPFSLLFEAPNLGPGHLPLDSEVYVTIPWRLTNGDWLIYIKDIKTRGVSGSCNSKEVLDLQTLRLEEHYVSKTDKPEALTNLERVYEGVHEVGSSMEGNQLTCSDAMCVTIQCAINAALFSGNSFVVVVEALLWAPTFVESELHLQFQNIISQSVIEVNDPDDVFSQPEDHEADYFNLATGIFTDTPSRQPVAPWIIAVSVIGGILLLLLLIFILYKCGFFNRETKDKMKKMSLAAAKASSENNEAIENDAEDGEGGTETDENSPNSEDEIQENGKASNGMV